MGRLKPVFPLVALLFSFVNSVGQELPNRYQTGDNSKGVQSIEFQIGILEDVVDPTEYRVGPGDQLLISIWGQVSQSVASMISAEGVLIVPSVREIDLRDLTLQDAKEKIRKEMSRVYVNADISITLTAPRRFKVNVTGASVKLTSVEVTPMDRVSNVLQKTLDWADTTLLKMTSQRNIQVIRKSGEILRADMTRRNQSGTLKTDPYVTNGDVIFVPPVYAKVSVYGAVAYPGTYEFVRGERLLDMIDLCGGLTNDADSSLAEIVSFVIDTSKVYKTKVIDLAAAIANPSDTVNNTLVRPDDRIFFKEKANFRRKANVHVVGEVQLPGTYPIVDRETRLSEIIQKAGGFTPDASLENILISRLAYYGGSPDREFERLKLTPLIEMTEIERSYFKAKTRNLNPNVQTDFVTLFSDSKIRSSFDVILQAEDYVFVGKSKQTVTVLGGVVLPGLFDLNTGADYKFYIDKAGGYANKAKRGDIKIIKSATKQWLDTDEDVDIQDGDVIFVPEKEPVDGWRIFRETLATVAQIAAVTSTIILIYFTINPRNSGN
jgi:protein involved in polysaccharide export with SLBB domain